MGGNVCRRFSVELTRTHATGERFALKKSFFGCRVRRLKSPEKSAFHSRRLLCVGTRDGDYSKGLKRDNGGAGVRWTHFLQAPRKYYFKLLSPGLATECEMVIKRKHLFISSSSSIRSFRLVCALSPKNMFILPRPLDISC
jgi:hypothetical protein